MRFWVVRGGHLQHHQYGPLCEPRILSGPVCPIYGFGMVIVVFCLTPLQKNWLLLFFGSMFLTSAAGMDHRLRAEKGVSHQLVGLFQSAF